MSTYMSTFLATALYRYCGKSVQDDHQYHQPRRARPDKEGYKNARQSLQPF